MKDIVTFITENNKELEKNTRDIAEKMLDGLLDNNDNNFKGTKEEKENFINFYTKKLIEKHIKSFDQLAGPYYYRSVNEHRSDGSKTPFGSSLYDIIDYNDYHFEKSYDDASVWIDHSDPKFITKENGVTILSRPLLSYRTIGISFKLGKNKIGDYIDYDEYIYFWYEFTYNGKKLKKPNYREIW